MSFHHAGPQHSMASDVALGRSAMGILNTFLSKPIGSLFVCQGGIDHQVWDCWSDGRIVTLGTFGDKTVKLQMDLVSIAPYDGPQLAEFIDLGRAMLAGGRAAMGVLAAGIPGALVGRALDKHAQGKASAQGLVCFDAGLKNGKTFVAVCPERVFHFLSGLLGSTEAS